MQLRLIQRAYYACYSRWGVGALGLAYSVVELNNRLKSGIFGFEWGGGANYRMGVLKVGLESGSLRISESMKLVQGLNQEKAEEI